MLNKSPIWTVKINGEEYYIWHTEEEAAKAAKLANIIDFEILWNGDLILLNQLRTKGVPLVPDIELWVNNDDKSVLVTESNMSFKVKVGNYIIKYKDGSLGCRSNVD